MKDKMNKMGLKLYEERYFNKVNVSLGEKGIRDKCILLELERN